MEDTWQEQFGIQQTCWPQIYKQKIWKINDKKLAEFNYKILCNILSNRALVSHWNKDIDENCPYCGIKQSTKHLLYDCIRIKTVWALIGNIIKLDVQYKHIVIGNTEENDYISCRNLLISYVAYAVYKFWIMAENKKLNFNTTNIIKFVKKDLFNRTLYNTEKYFTNLCDLVITYL